MNQVFKTFHPLGFHTVNAYLFATKPEELIDFLKKAFSAKENNRSLTPRVKLLTASFKWGDSSFMVSQTRGEFMGMRTSFYLYVNDVDGVYKHALAHGAKISFPPDDMPYGDRQAGVIDPAGNYWWISQRLVEEDYDE